MSQKSHRPGPETDWNPAHQPKRTLHISDPTIKANYDGEDRVYGFSDLGTTSKGDKIRKIPYVTRQPGIDYDSDEYEIVSELDNNVIGAPINMLGQKTIDDMFKGQPNSVGASLTPGMVTARNIGHYSVRITELHWYGQFHGACRGHEVLETLYDKFRQEMK